MLIAIRRKRNYLSRVRPRISLFERRADKRASTNYRRVVGFSRKKKKSYVCRTRGGVDGFPMAGRKLRGSTIRQTSLVVESSERKEKVTSQSFLFFSFLF